MPKYSLNGTNKPLVTLVGTREVPVQRQADTETLQSPREQVAAPVEEAVTVQEQAQEVEIQRQCFECQEEEKDSDEMSSLGVFAKLTGRAPGDKYEQEADRVALQVMAMPDSATKPQSIQRQSQEDETLHKLQNKHPVFKSITVVDGKDSRNYEYVFRSVVDTQTVKAEGDDAEHVAAKQEVTRILGTQFPDLANIINQLIDDKKHPLGLVRDIVDASRRQRTLALIKGMAEKKILGDQSFDQFLQRNPGAGLLFEKVPDGVNFDEQGRSRKKSFVEDQKQVDPARAVGADLTEEQENQVKDYARRLSQEVEPKVRQEVEALANKIKQKLVGEVVVSVRTKSAAGLIDKVQRMVKGAKGRNVRSGYQIGDVIDAVGARITVDNTEQLTALLQEIRGQLGSRILEIENMYASPKSHAPAYRVIPMVIKTEINGNFYTFELQLNTMRADIAADLEHNTIFKPLVQVTEEQKQMIKRIMESAAALDQLETKKV